MVPPPFDFNPRSPYGERLAAMGARQLYRRISIHAPLTGSDLRDFDLAAALAEFQSTLPLRGATLNQILDSLLK